MIRKYTFIIIAILVSFFAIQAQTINEIQQLLADDGTNPDRFGTSIDISGNYAVIGSEYDNPNGTNSGSAYIYYYNNNSWELLKKIVPTDGTENDRFGSSVSISGEYAVVAAEDAEAVYFFYKDQGGEDNWGQIKKHTGTYYFGESVSICDTIAVIGETDENGIGHIHIYYKNLGGINNWGKIRIKTPETYIYYSYFGSSVSISEDKIIVGAPGDLNSESGRAYIFEKDFGGTDYWNERKIINYGTATGALYGYSVGISGDYVIIGTYRKHEINTFSGAAYIFKKDQGGANNWGCIKTLTPTFGSGYYDWFGYSVKILGEYAVVGTGLGCTQQGQAYIYGRNHSGIDQWGEMGVFEASDHIQYDHFGVPVVISEHSIMVGKKNSNEGSVYVFDTHITRNPQNQTEVCPDEEIRFSVTGCFIENYQWQESTDGGNNFIDLTDDEIYTGTLTDTLKINVSTGMNNNKYRCVVQNSGTSYTSDNATLTIEITPPSMTVQNITVQLDETGNTSITPQDVVTSATDNCAIADTILSQNNFDCSNVEIPVNVEVTLTDVSGNSTVEIIEVTVEDNIVPILQVQDITVQLDDAGNASIFPVDVVINASDNCNIEDTTISQSTFDCSNIGNLMNVGVTLFDVSGNSTSETVQVIVEDNINPTVNCIDNQIINLNEGEISYTIQGSEFDPISINDNCEIETVINNFNYESTLENVQIPLGTTILTWVIIDNSGNSETCSFSITVNEYVSIETLTELGISIYPNPTDGQFTIENARGYELTIKDISGKIIYIAQISDISLFINLNLIKNGIYLINFKSDTQNITTKLMVK